MCEHASEEEAHLCFLDLRLRFLSLPLAMPPLPMLLRTRRDFF